MLKRVSKRSFQRHGISLCNHDTLTLAFPRGRSSQQSTPILAPQIPDVHFHLSRATLSYLAQHVTVRIQVCKEGRAVDDTGAEDIVRHGLCWMGPTFSLHATANRPHITIVPPVASACTTIGLCRSVKRIEDPLSIWAVLRWWPSIVDRSLGFEIDEVAPIAGRA